MKKNRLLSILAMLMVTLMANSKVIALNETYYIGDVIQFNAAPPFVYVLYDDDPSGSYIGYLTSGETTVTKPTWDARWSQWKFDEVLRYEPWDSSRPLRITGTADKEPIGFKCVGGTGTSKDPFTFELVYSTNTVELDETDDASWIITNNEKVCDVTLGRTLQAGGWNTFAVPFSTAVPTGWTVKKLVSSDVVGELLSLNFEDATSIEAGTPYLVKVDANVENPTFEGVTISSETNVVETACADFIPAVNPTEVAADESNLFVIGNTLTYPRENGTLNGFRAYFRLKNTANSARSFQMFFGDETTGIRTIGSTTTGNSAIYDIQGRRVSNPTRGLYIVNGKKVVIK